MVKTTYPAQWKYINKWSVIAYGMFFFCPLHWTIYTGHLHWKKGKLPRLSYNDLKYTKFMNARGARDKILLGPALEVYPDQTNYMHQKYMKQFFKKHRPL